jgi:ribose-phosphate pyrophosphokinase
VQRTVVTDNLVAVRDITVFSGSAHPELAAEICNHLGTTLEPTRVSRFANDCLEIQLQANCRERDVFLIQPLVPPVQEHLVELLLMIDAARGASAGRITVVMPHYAYARSDKKDTPRVSIGGRLVADLLATAGASRVLTMTLHSPQVHGFFSIPVDHLHALHELASHFRRKLAEPDQHDRRRKLAEPEIGEAIVVSPDLGGAKEAAAFARLLGVPVAVGAKQRFSNDRVTISAIIGDVSGRDVIVLDDEIAKGTTVIELLGHLQANGARSVRIAATHGLFSDGALRRLADRDDVAEIVCTNTVPLPDDSKVDKLTVLSIAPAFAEAIRRIHNGESVSVLFDHETASS